MKIELGNKVKDRVTGFTGIAVCKAIYLNGCVQYDVKPQVDEKGQIVKGLWVDEAQLEFVDPGILDEPEEPGLKKKPKQGGMRDHPH